MEIHPMTARNGGKILVDQLLIQGVDRVTCVPGESYLAALDAMHDADIDVLICRHEGGAAIMAESYGKLTGKPGICFVTRGPGAMNAAHGVHIAQHDSTPMILFIGQVERAMRGRGAFQEMDYEAVFGSTAKWVVEINDVRRIPEIMARAFAVAMQGRPGPVVISLPEDVLTDTAEVADSAVITPVKPELSITQLQQFETYLHKAKRPMIILGGSCWSDEGCAAIADFAARFKIPVATEFRRTALFPALHASYAGDLGFGQNPKLSQRVKDADLLILLGARMAEVPSASYTLIDIPQPTQPLIHVFPDAGEIGKVYQPALGIVCAAVTVGARVVHVDQIQLERRVAHQILQSQNFVDARIESPDEHPGESHALFAFERMLFDGFGQLRQRPTAGHGKKLFSFFGNRRGERNDETKRVSFFGVASDLRNKSDR